VPDPGASQTYLLQVDGSQAGGFQLGVQFTGETAALEPLFQGTVFAPGSAASGSLHVVSGRGFHLVLSAHGDAGRAVQLAPLRPQPRTPLSLAATAGDTTTATLFLPAGDYEVRAEAPASQQGPLTADLGVIGLSDPLGPAARDVVRDPVS